jgi:integrase/recombinase XerD
MSGLRARAEDYLAMRRALGFKLDSWGLRLMSFIGFCEARGATTVTTDLAVEWATTTSRGSGHEVYQARRLDVVRIFARHLQPLDPAAEVPPGDVLDRRQCRVPPYLYSPQEVTALMAAARTLQPAFRALTWRDAHRAAGRDRHAPGRGLPAGQPGEGPRPGTPSAGSGAGARAGRAWR